MLLFCNERETLGGLFLIFVKIVSKFLELIFSFNMLLFHHVDLF